MECCENKNILKEKEMHFCTNCGVIHGYSWIEYNLKFNEYDQNIYNLLKCKNIIYKRQKYLNKKYNLDKRTILFLDESFENIKKHLKLERLPINKYFNTKKLSLKPDHLLQDTIRHCIMLTYNSLENIR